MLVAALMDTLFPAPGVRFPVPTKVNVLVGEPLMDMLVTGPVPVYCTVPLLVKLPPSTLIVIRQLDFKITVFSNVTLGPLIVRLAPFSTMVVVSVPGFGTPNVRPPATLTAPDAVSVAVPPAAPSIRPAVMLRGPSVAF